MAAHTSPQSRVHIPAAAHERLKEKPDQTRDAVKAKKSELVQATFKLLAKDMTRLDRRSKLTRTPISDIVRPLILLWLAKQEVEMPLKEMEAEDRRNRKKDAER
jgi:hypothetical protein